jgi:hypothetical protein
LRYTYKPGKKEVDKRFITILSLTPNVSSQGQGVSSDRQGGIVQETIGYRPTDEGVSSKQGGTIQDLLNNRLNNVLDNELDKLLDNEKIEKSEVEVQLDYFNNLIKENKFENSEDRFNAYQERNKLNRILIKID